MPFKAAIKTACPKLHDSCSRRVTLTRRTDGTIIGGRWSIATPHQRINTSRERPAERPVPGDQRAGRKDFAPARRVGGHLALVGEPKAGARLRSRDRTSAERLGRRLVTERSNIHRCVEAENALRRDP